MNRPSFQPLKIRLPLFLLVFLLAVGTPLVVYRVFFSPPATTGETLGSFEDNGDEDDEDQGRDDQEKKDEDKGGTKTVEMVVNDDGTTSEIRREVGNGESEVEIRTFNPAGFLVETRKVEVGEGGEQAVKVKTYDAFGNELRVMKLEIEPGREIELKIKEGETEISKVEYDVENQELRVRTGDEEALKIKAFGKNFRLERAGIGVLTNFPMTVDETTGQIFVQTPVGEVELKAMPDTMVEKARLSDGLAVVDNVTLEGEGGPKYRLTGTKAERLLGVFNLRIPTQLIYDAASGDFVRREQTFVNRLLDLFSF